MKKNTNETYVIEGKVDGISCLYVNDGETDISNLDRYFDRRICCRFPVDLATLVSSSLFAVLTAIPGNANHRFHFRMPCPLCRQAYNDVWRFAGSTIVELVV